MTREFIRGNPKYGLRGRPSDMLGLVTFARVAQVLVPLTLDHEMLLDALGKMSVVKRKEQDGTSIGYAIMKTANLIVATRHFAEDLRGAGRPAYDIESTIMILVTDGLQTTHPEDRGHPLRTVSVMEAARFAKENDIRLYIVNVEPALAYPQFENERLQLEEASALTGGKFYLADRKKGLVEIYQAIDQLEKSILPDEVLASGKVIEKKGKSDDEPEKIYNREPYAPAILSIALFVLVASLFLECSWLRRAP
jgi:Ca-activated chloride channel family protein